MALDVTSTGIAFTPQGGSDVNLLNDYEEGAWAPSHSGFTFNIADGSYTKVGQLVHAAGKVTFSNSSTNSTAWGGSPFTSHNDSYFCGNVIWLNVAPASSVIQLNARVQGNATTYTFYGSKHNSNWDDTLASNNTDQLVWDMTFYTNS